MSPLKSLVRKWIRNVYILKTHLGGILKYRVRYAWNAMQNPLNIYPSHQITVIWQILFFSLIPTVHKDPSRTVGDCPWTLSYTTESLFFFAVFCKSYWVEILTSSLYTGKGFSYSWAFGITVNNTDCIVLWRLYPILIAFAQHIGKGLFAYL